MKWLFIIVALLNIAFGAYNLFLADESDSKNTQLNTADKSQIVLLNELNAKALKELQDKVLPSKAIIDEIKRTGSVKTSSETEVGPVSVVNNDKDSTQGLIDRTKNLCYKLGPFSKKAMNNIRSILEKEYKNQLSFAIETTSAITYYRIYIPPLKSKTEIKKALKILDKNGLKDHYIMSINGRKNAIALGVFKERSAAEKIASKATKIGLSTTIEAISDDKKSLYQLSVIFQKDQETTRYQKIVKRKKLISVECNK